MIHHQENGKRYMDIYCILVSKAVPLHAMEALGGEEI
jgi:hypothetical protein